MLFQAWNLYFNFPDFPDFSIPRTNPAPCTVYGVGPYPLAKDSAWELARVFQDIKAYTRDQDLWHVHSQPFLLHSCLPFLEAVNATLVSVRNDDEVIGVKEFSGNSRTELAQQGLKY